MSKHIHIHFPPRRAGVKVTRDQAPGSVPAATQHPPQEVAKLVAALMQAIADRQGMTQDAGFDESKHKRDESGRFSAVSVPGADFVAHPSVKHRHISDNPKAHALVRKHLTALGYKHSTTRSERGLNFYHSEHPQTGHRVMVTSEYGNKGQVQVDDLGKRKTTDAGEWDESKHPRGEGGRFSSAEHQAASLNHGSAEAAHHNASALAGAGPLAAMHLKAATAHKEAREAHEAAAKHMEAGTGLGDEFAAQAHAKTHVAKGHSDKLAPLAGGNTMGAAYSHLKKIASDPSQPVMKRAEAAEKLAKIEKAANKVAESPHAKAVTGPDPARMAKPGIPAKASRADLEHQLKATGEQSLAGYSGGAGPGDPEFNPKRGTPEWREHIKKLAEGASQTAEQSGLRSSAAAAAKAAAPVPATGPAGEKPTASTAKGKAAVHQLLSTGHPFSVDELMKATGVTNKSTMMTALSDLKNPKYAGALGALQIVKRPDGMYHVEKAPEGGFKAIGAGAAAAGGSAAATTSSAGAAGGEGAPVDRTAVVHGSHPLSPYLPNQTLKAKGTKGATYKVLGHNHEGHVVVQHADTGAKHAVEPGQLAKISDKHDGGAPAKSPTEPVSVKEAPNQAYGKAEGLKPGPGNTNVRQGQPLEKPKKVRPTVMGPGNELVPEGTPLTYTQTKLGDHPGALSDQEIEALRKADANAPWRKLAAKMAPAMAIQPKPSKAKNPSGALIRNAPTSELQKIASKAKSGKA